MASIFSQHSFGQMETGHLKQLLKTLKINNTDFSTRKKAYKHLYSDSCLFSLVDGRIRTSINKLQVVAP